jgi:hypothetical protein
MNYSEQYKVPDLPEGKSGTWEIKRFEVKKEDLVRQLFSMANSGRYVPEGVYTGLFRKDDDNRYTTIMSDTPDEINDHWQPINKAEGDVLIAGLGLGVVLNALAKKKEVNHITIVELSTDVLTLVKKHYEVKYPGKITFIQADILTWKPPQDIHWNYAWFDIWDNLSIDNLPEMAKLHRKFTRFVDAYGSWGQKYLQSRQKQEHRERERWRS